MRQRRRLTWSLLAAAAAGGLLGLAWTARPWLAGWDEPPAAARAAASAAVTAAARDGAHRLAGPAMAAAESTLAAAHLAEARQLGRWPAFRRDYREAAGAFAAASAAAAQACSAAAGRASTEAEEARALVALAQAQVAAIESAAREMPFPRRARTQLRTARTELDESRLLLDRGRGAEAAAAARRALDSAAAARDAALPATARFADEAQVRTWRRWIDETIAWSQREGRPAIVVYKEKRLLVVYDKGRPVATYTADLGRNRLQQKHHAGDKATPEGRYRITARKQGGQTKYHKALLLDYPNEEDRSRFARIRAEGGVPDGVGPGRWIEIHGHGGRQRDWTDGCVALADADIDAVFARVDVGTPVTIVGGDGRDGAFSSLWRTHAAEIGR